MGILQKIFGSKNQREVSKLRPLVARINDLGPGLEGKSDAQLKALTGDLRQRVDNGASLDDVLPEAFALVREGGKRALGMRHYDVQLIGGMVLHSGRISEMRTGEGKTLVATLGAYLNALSGKGVHVVTVNDYLARRDAEWMGRLYGFLGLSTGVIVHGLTDLERQRAYAADITYGQNNEFGFDYLRDNMKDSPDRMVQRGLNFAIVDEVDSILIDEARTPLIISGAAEAAADLYLTVDKIIPRLKRDVDYVVDEKAHNTMLTDDGVERVEKLLGVDNLYDAKNLQLNHHVVQALRAHTLYKRDVNYLVEDGKVVIVDEFTGRKMPGRRWSDGLHQAIEAKEGVEVEEENQTLATVTFQNYFRMYGKLSGMTGTADTEATEFHQIYKLDVVVIPTNRPIVRKDLPDLVYKNEKGKFKAVLADLEDCHQRGQPVLVGTVSVEKSEVLAKLLREKGLPFNVLNAKQHQKEAMIVAQAGRKGAITISTNMAGRGTDILLGGNPEVMAKDELAEEKERLAAAAAAARAAAAEPGDDAEGAGPFRGAVVPDFDEDQRLAELLAKYKAQCDAERKDVMAAGGLKIVGTERHESRRIDNQLRGRAGRQGDPGVSRFYLSLEDDLLRIFGLDKMSGLMERLGLDDETPIESPMVTRSIEGAQKKVEGRNFDTRKNVLEYDDVMNQQRKTIYALRRQVLEGRYVPEQSEEDRKKKLPPPEPATSSGDWTVESLAVELTPRLVALIDDVAAKVAQRDAEQAAGTPVREQRPHWRILRGELWRQHGALLDLEHKVPPKDEAAAQALLASIANQVASSLVQQRERLFDLCETLIASAIEQHCPSAESEEAWNVDALEDALGEQFNREFELEGKLDAENFAAQAWSQVEARLAERDTELGRAFLMYFARHFMLEEIDAQWIDHLKNMDSLREGIGLMGYGQKDPKKEYKRIGFEMFAEMMARIQANVGTKLFRVEVRRQDEALPAVAAAARPRQMVMSGAAGKTDATESSAGDGRGAARPPARAAAATAGGAAADGGKRERPKVGRNDPCPCGSGKKYKKCHGRDEAEAAGE